MSMWFELSHSGKCALVEVKSFTDKTVTLAHPNYGKGRRNRLADFYCYFPTFEEAKEYAVGRAVKEVTALRLRLERANGDLGRIRGMKNPLEATS